MAAKTKMRLKKERVKMYGCLTCGYAGVKYMIHVHYFEKHVPLTDIPFRCRECGVRYNNEGKAQFHSRKRLHMLG